MVKTINTIDMVSKAQSGCQYALNRLSIDVCRRIYPALLRMTEDEDLSRDLLQETLLAMLRHLKTLEQVEKFWGWIHTIAQNKVRDHFRKRSCMEISGLTDYDRVSGINNNTVLKTVFGKEMKEQIATAIGNLHKQNREVVRLRYFENRSYADIASMTGCSVQQARMRFFRAKRYLQRNLCSADFRVDR